MPYHGNYLANLEEFLDDVKPTYAVITSSEDEKEDARTLKALFDRRVKYYLTREQDWIIMSDGKEIEIE